MVERLTEEGLFTRADGMLVMLEETGELDAKRLSHLLNSFDRLYTKRYEEYRIINDQHHELASQQTKKESEFRRLLDRYQRLSAANEPLEKGGLAKFFSETAKTIGRFLPSSSK